MEKLNAILMSGTVIIMGQKVLHLPFILIFHAGFFTVHMLSVDNMHGKFKKKCFLKEKGTCICTIPTSSLQITCIRYLNFPQIFVMKILKGVNEVLLHFHVQGVLYLREFPQGLPHLTKRWACKVIRKPLNIKEQRWNALAVTGPLTNQTWEQLPVFWRQPRQETVYNALWRSVYFPSEKVHKSSLSTTDSMPLGVGASIPYYREHKSLLFLWKGIGSSLPSFGGASWWKWKRRVKKLA